MTTEKNESRLTCGHSPSGGGGLSLTNSAGQLTGVSCTFILSKLEFYEAAVHRNYPLIPPGIQACKRQWYSRSMLTVTH